MQTDSQMGTLIQTDSQTDRKKAANKTSAENIAGCFFIFSNTTLQIIMSPDIETVFLVFDLSMLGRVRQ